MVRLDQFDNSWYNSGTAFSRVAWYLVNMFFINTQFPFPSRFKCFLLRLFGAEVGKGVVIKPSVNIKYPWLLNIGSYVWIGENVWIDNLARVRIESHVCISQGAYLLTGNHNYKKTTFDLVTEEIRLEEGVWIGAKSIVCPGVVCHSHAVLTAGSVLSQDAASYTIYRGNPATATKARKISTEPEK